MNNEIKKSLKELYPTARTGFIDVVVDAIELHSKKNNDYNRDNNIQIISKFETMSKMADVRRKYSRLFHLITEEKEMKVNEKLEDTAIDLGVYAFLLTEYIRELKK